MALLIRTEIFQCSIQQFRASMQRLHTRLGVNGWISSDNIRIMFGEYPYTQMVYTTLSSPSGRYMKGIYDWKANYDDMIDTVKRPPTRASWEVAPWNSSSMRPWWKPQKDRYSPSRYLAGIEAYEEANNRTRVDFLDGYNPDEPLQGYLPIGSAFEEFSRMVIEEIQSAAESTIWKILFLAANPLGTIRLRLDEEIRSIDEALRQTEYRERFSISQHWGVRVTDIQELLLRYKPDIVHFSGHGSASSEIILEDKMGIGHPVPIDALSDLFCILKDNIRCVVLNACYSEKQARAIAQHIDYVVGMSRGIDDISAISFAMAFYRALGYGRDIEVAFRLGCLAINLENLGEQDVPKLITRNDESAKIALVDQDE
jgi:hypothetical protein